MLDKEQEALDKNKKLPTRRVDVDSAIREAGITAGYGTPSQTEMNAFLLAQEASDSYYPRVDLRKHPVTPKGTKFSSRKKKPEQQDELGEIERLTLTEQRTVQKELDDLEINTCEHLYTVSRYLTFVVLSGFLPGGAATVTAFLAILHYLGAVKGMGVAREYAEEILDSLHNLTKGAPSKDALAMLTGIDDPKLRDAEKTVEQKQRNNNKPPKGPKGPKEPKGPKGSKGGGRNKGGEPDPKRQKANEQPAGIKT
jgi:hypothetical protein